MHIRLSKKTIVQKTVQVATATLLSRLFGIVREVLMVSYLGAGALSDAFIAAFRIPNSLRKIFAEGALSATFIPTLVATMRKDGQQSANRLMTIGFLVFEGGVLLICALAMFKADVVLKFVAPGFSDAQILNAIPLLHLLMPFILFISSSALLAGALQAAGKFLIPAYAQVILNSIVITGLLVILHFNLPVTYLCIVYLLGGCITFIAHFLAYLRLNFNFSSINFATLKTFWLTLVRFIPCSISMSITEVSAIIDCRFSSYLAVGTLSLVNYANRFLGIPVGVFGVAFSTILLPHLSHIGTYAPRRMSFYLLEASKLIFWVMLPAAIIMSIVSEKFFHTIFVATGKFSIMQAEEAGRILTAYLIGLASLSFNKILLNVYYALHSAWIPFWISVITTAINIGANMALIGPYGATGLALATSLSVIIQTVLLVILLNTYFGLRIYIGVFMHFLLRYTIQLICILLPALYVYTWMPRLIAHSFPTWNTFLLFRLGFWLWASPLWLIALLVIFITRKLFGIRLYFID